MGVWSVPIVNGHPSGAAVLIRPDVGPVNASLGVTKAGALFLGFQTSGPNIFVASMDPSTGKLVTEPKAIVDGYLQANRQPKWSPDGKSIAYISNRPTGPENASGGENVLVIQSVDTGQIRDIRPLVSWFLNPGWAPDGSIVIGGSNLKGRRAIFHVDSEKGEVSEIVPSPPGTCTNGHEYSSSPTGQFLVYRLGCNTSMTLMVRDLASGLDRELVRFKDLAGPSASPDGRLVAYVSRDSSARLQTLSVIPFEGGAARVLFRVSSPLMLGGTIRWMPDGRRLVVVRGEGN
jgi:Tol biopolymer transport system component